MGQLTNIEWTDKTWNPWHGCHKISQGCKNCYMFRDKKRYGQDLNVVTRSKTKFWDPLSWPKVPSMCFTCSWSDWFIEEADAWRDEAYEIIRQTPWITYQILTKRVERAAGRIPDPPLPNIWFGVSVENQPTADARIPIILEVPAAKRFISYEPALGPVDLISRPLAEDPSIKRNWLTGEFYNVPFVINGGDTLIANIETTPRINWVIVGGESGPDARPFDIGWARDIIAQCKAAGVACFVKQLGAHPYPGRLGNGRMPDIALKDRKGGNPNEWPDDLRLREFPAC